MISIVSLPFIYKRYIYNLGLSLKCLIIFTACSTKDANAATCVADDNDAITDLKTCKVGFTLQPNKEKCVGKFMLCLRIGMSFHKLNNFNVLPSPSKLF